MRRRGAWAVGLALAAIAWGLAILAAVSIGLFTLPAALLLAASARVMPSS